MKFLFKSCLGPLFYAQRAGLFSLTVSICKIFIRLMFFKFTIIGGSSERVLFINNSTDRPDLLHDYDVLREYFLSKAVKSDSISFESKLDLWCLNFRNIIKIFENKDILFTNYKMLLQYGSFEVSTLSKIYLFLRVGEALVIFQNFVEHLDSSPATQIIVHKEMEFLQNIFVLAAKRKGIQTIALQHGYYEDSGGLVNTKNVNSINYLASVADIIWCWGESTRSLFLHYTSAQVSVIGIPSQVNTGNLQLKKKYAIILDSVDRIESNPKLEMLAKQHHGELFYHPDDPRYKEHVGALLSSDAKIYLGCHSSLLLLARLAGRRVFVLPGSRLLDNESYKINKSSGLVEFTEGLLKRHIRYSGLQSCELAFESLKSAGDINQ